MSPRSVARWRESQRELASSLPDCRRHLPPAELAAVHGLPHALLSRPSPSLTRRERRTQGREIQRDPASVSAASADDRADPARPSAEVPQVAVFPRSSSSLSLSLPFFSQVSTPSVLVCARRPSWMPEVLRFDPRPGETTRPMRCLALLLALYAAYSAVELAVGLLTGLVGLVSDAFHLTFGCDLLSFSLFAMAASRTKPDSTYTYGYKRLEVLAAFTNALFLLFLSFSLAVEALHSFMQDESEHKHYLIVSAVTNLLVNLLGVWFFRSYARVNIVYRKAEDMNHHSICLHVLADSVRSAGLILASWFLSLGIENAEVLCLGIVSVAVFMLVMPLFKATGNVLLQIAPGNVPPSALIKCGRQITACEDVSEVSQARFWELVPGHAVGCLSIRVKNSNDDQSVLEYVHGLYEDLGIHDLTIQTEKS